MYWFCFSCDHTPNKSKGGELLLSHDLRVHSVILGKVQWQEHEAAGHVASVVRRWKDTHAGAQLSLGDNAAGIQNGSFLLS